MAYDDGFETVEISEEDLTEAQRIIIEGFIREGGFQTREKLINFLEADVKEYLDEVDEMPNEEWLDGVRYAIHVIREAKFDGDGL